MTSAERESVAVREPKAMGGPQERSRSSRRSRSLQGHWSRPVRMLWILVALSAACAATSSIGSPTQSRHISGSSDEGTGQFRDWGGLIKTLAATGGSCKARSRARDDGSPAIVFPAICLFVAGGTTVSEEARPMVAAIAGELAGAIDREFWISVHASTVPDTERVNRTRAAALVRALIRAGVAPGRLASVVGFAPPDSTPPENGVVVGDAALIEIVASPVQGIASPPVSDQ